MARARVVTIPRVHSMMIHLGGGGGGGNNGMKEMGKRVELGSCGSRDTFALKAVFCEIGFVQVHFRLSTKECLEPNGRET